MLPAVQHNPARSLCVPTSQIRGKTLRVWRRAPVQLRAIALPAGAPGAGLGASGLARPPALTQALCTNSGNRRLAPRCLCPAPSGTVGHGTALGGPTTGPPPQSQLLLGLCLGLKGSWWAPMGGFEGGLPHPLVTMGLGERALLVGGGSCATAVPAHPERIPVRGAGDIPDPWGHQKGTPDPADTRGERGDPLSRAWPVGVPGDTSAPPRDPPRGRVLAPSSALPPAPAASSDVGPGDATGVLAGTSEPGRFWRGVGLPFGGLQPCWGCWNGEGWTDGRGGPDRRPDSCARRLRCRAGWGAHSELPAPNPICPQHAAGRHRAPEGIFVRC